MKTLTSTIAAVATLGIAATANATTPISGQLNLVANSTIGNVSLSQVNNQSWAAAPTLLAAAVDANLGVAGDTLDTHANASADWFSADAGSIDLRNYGWDFAVFTSPTSGSDLTQNRGGSDWSYTFTATANGLFKMTYLVAGSNNTFGLWGWSINCNCVGSGGPVINPFDPAASGTFTAPLVNGQTYTITLDGNPNIGWSSAPGNYSGSMLGEFDWSITSAAVPEPATWAFMIGGLGVAGAALRRRGAITLAA